MKARFLRMNNTLISFVGFFQLINVFINGTIVCMPSYPINILCFKLKYYVWENFKNKE